MRLAAPLLVVATAACAARTVAGPAQTAQDYTRARLEFRCEEAWDALSKEEQRDQGRDEFFATCRGQDTALMKAIAARTTSTLVSERIAGKRATVVLRFELPDTQGAFEESFRNEVNAIGDEVAAVLSGNAPPAAPAEGAPRLTDPKSDAWLAEQASRPDAPRMQVEHTFRLVRGWKGWRVDDDPLRAK